MRLSLLSGSARSWPLAFTLPNRARRESSVTPSGDDPSKPAILASGTRSGLSNASVSVPFGRVFHDRSSPARDRLLPARLPIAIFSMARLP